MAIDPELFKIIGRLQQWAKSTTEVRRMWVYGSRLNGTALRDSDFDLAVDTDPPPHEESAKGEFQNRILIEWRNELQALSPWEVRLNHCREGKVREYLACCSMLIYERSIGKSGWQMVKLSEGAKIRAQIDSDSMKAMLAVAGGGAAGLLAFLPYVLGKPCMQSLAQGVMWGLMCLVISVVLCIVHNVLRRHCSAIYEQAWIDGRQPPPGEILWFYKLKKHPRVCFWSWTLLWLAVFAFAAGAAVVGFGAYETLHEVNNGCQAAVF